MKPMFLLPVGADALATAAERSDTGDKGEAEGFEAMLALVATQASAPAPAAKLPVAPAPAQLSASAHGEGQLANAGGRAVSGEPALGAGLVSGEPSLGAGLVSGEPGFGAGLVSGEPSLGAGLVSGEPGLGAGLVSAEPDEFSAPRPEVHAVHAVPPALPQQSTGGAPAAITPPQRDAPAGGSAAQAGETSARSGAESTAALDRPAADLSAAPAQPDASAVAPPLPSMPSAPLRGEPAQSAGRKVQDALVPGTSTAKNRVRPASLEESRAVLDESRAAPAPALQPYVGPAAGGETAVRQAQPAAAPGSRAQWAAAPTAPGSGVSNESARPAAAAKSEASDADAAHAVLPHGVTITGDAEPLDAQASVSAVPARATASAAASSASREAGGRVLAQVDIAGLGAPVDARTGADALDSSHARAAVRTVRADTAPRRAGEPDASSPRPAVAVAAPEPAQPLAAPAARVPERVGPEVVEQTGFAPSFGPASALGNTAQMGKQVARADGAAQVAPAGGAAPLPFAQQLAAEGAVGAPSTSFEAAAAEQLDALPEGDVAQAGDGAPQASAHESTELDGAAARDEQTAGERGSSRESSEDAASREDAAARFAEQWARNTSGGPDLEVQGARGLEAVVASLLRAGRADGDSATQDARRTWTSAAQPVQSEAAASATATRVKLAEGVSATPGGLARPRREAEDEWLRERALSPMPSPTEFAKRNEPPAPNTPAPVPAAPMLTDLQALQRAGGQDPAGATISLHHPELGDVDLVVQNQNGRIEVRAVLETPHAAQVLRAQESALRYGIQQAGMTMGTLRVRSRAPVGEPAKARENSSRRRRDHEWEA